MNYKPTAKLYLRSMDNTTLKRRVGYVVAVVFYLRLVTLPPEKLSVTLKVILTLLFIVTFLYFRSRRMKRQ